MMIEVRDDEFPFIRRRQPVQHVKQHQGIDAPQKLPPEWIVLGESIAAIGWIRRRAPTSHSRRHAKQPVDRGKWIEKFRVS